jgi:S-formylglutathione hydrolase FrmB
MALLQVNFFSNSLRKQTAFNALIPLDRAEGPSGRPMKALYLLHGYSGNYMDWVCNSNIQELSLKHEIAVFMPSGENFFYLDDIDMNSLYSEYIGSELVEFTRKMFPISDKREDTFIGGLSMGGYGAIRNGLKYNRTFSRIIALSSALITYRIAYIPVNYKDDVADYNYYTRVFGDVNKIIGSDKDPEALILSLKQEKKQIPEIFMACGTEDFLLEENRKFHKFLDSEQIEHKYFESPGTHDWKFWNEYIKKGIGWAVY